MKYKHIALLFFLYLMPFNQVSTQALDLNVLDKLSQQLDNQNNSNTFPNEEQERIQIPNTEETEEIIEETEEFGYQGNRDFNVPQKPKIFAVFKLPTLCRCGLLSFLTAFLYLLSIWTRRGFRV